MDGKSFGKSLVVGLIGALGMFILMKIGINTGMAPFNVPPSGAFTATLGLPPMPLGIIVHFLYGAFWSMVLVAIYKGRTTFGKGIGLSIILWLIMMVIYSPLIGWGFFGFGEAGNMPSDAKLYLAPGIKYAIVTLIIHLVYGALVGWLDTVWAVKHLKATPEPGAEPAA